MLNARIRKRYLMGRFKVGVVGPQVDLTYKSDYLGAGPQTLTEIANGTHPFAQVLKDAERPMIVVGQGALAREDGAGVLAAARALASPWQPKACAWSLGVMAMVRAVMGFRPPVVRKSLQVRVWQPLPGPACLLRWRVAAPRRGPRCRR